MRKSLEIKLELTESQMEWLKEMLNTEIDEHLRTATNNHIFALGSKSNKEAIAFEKLADENRDYARQLDAIFRMLR